MSISWVAAQFLTVSCLLAMTQGIHEEARHPCAFIDTINITGSYNMGSALNNSYVHNWTLIPRELVTAYDFIIENGIRVPAKRHLRACICKLRPCVRFCCSAGQFYDLQERSCLAAREGQPQPPGQSHMDIELHNGTQSNIELRSLFSVYEETPCDHMKAYTKDTTYLNWTLHEVRSTGSG